MTYLCIIADDLTGACDTGAAFARHGRDTLVVLDAGRNPIGADAPVMVYSTESRYLPREQAVRAVEQLTRQLSAQRRCGVVYKKIDSTLRGHPGDELDGLMRALGVDHALVAPAFPAQGRTTSGGIQRVASQPLEWTPFATEASGEDTRGGDLRAVFGGRGRATRVISLAEVRQGVCAVAEMLDEPRIVIADAETDADLAILATAARSAGVAVLCGSAGLARALADIGPVASTCDAPQARQGAVLVVAGSRNPATIRQVEAAGRLGNTVIAAPSDFITGAATGAVSQLAQAACDILATGRDVILTTAGTGDSPLGKDAIAQRFGALVTQVLARVDVAALVLTGGDIAAAVCTALGAQRLRLHGELQPGIALGELADGAHAGLPVVTKAGGFGGERAIADILSALHQS
ncbi:MAG: hypothetical protein M1434_09920 [Chloroflexi bacterium]|nr:hypothetical protein [Chloroflexota bacterium]